MDHDVSRDVGSRSISYQDSDGEWDEENGQGINFRDVKAAAYRQRWIVLAFAAAGLALGLIACIVVPRGFEATSVIQFQKAPTLLEGQKAVNPAIDDGDFQRQVQAAASSAKSRELAQRVAGRLQLQKQPQVLKGLGLSLRPSLSEVTDSLRSHLSAQPSINGDSLRLTFTTRDPQVSASLANGYAENLISLSLERQYETSSYARQFLAGKVAETGQQLAISEAAADGFAQRAGIVQSYSPDGNSMTSLSAESLRQLNGEFTTANATRVRTEQRWRQASVTPLLSIAEVQSNSAIQRLQAERAGLAAELAKLRGDFRDDYPAVVRLRAQVGQIDREVRILATQLRTSLQDQYLTAARQEAALASKLDELRSRSMAEQARIAQLDRLNRSAAANRGIYNTLVERLQEVGAAAGVAVNNMVISERAAPPAEPAVPSIPLFLLGGLGIGLVMGAAVAVLKELTNQPIRTPDDISHKLRMPLLGVIPLAPNERSVHVDLADPRSPVAEAYHSLRSSLDYAFQTPPRSVFITSTRAGEGKSTTALALALDYAHLGQKTLLVDGDLRRPQLHSLLAVGNEEGLSDVLDDKCPLDSVVQHLDQFDFISSGAPSGSPAQLLRPERLEALVDYAKSHYNVVVIDGPPVTSLADAPLIAREVDATIIVVESGKVERGLFQSAARRLRESRARLAGVVLSKFDAKSTGYGPDYNEIYGYRV